MLLSHLTVDAYPAHPADKRDQARHAYNDLLRSRHGRPHRHSYQAIESSDGGRDLGDLVPIISRRT